MTEPLLRRLHARGERLTVGAVPWVAPVYRAMPQVDEVIEFPFRHGGLQWRARRALGRQLQGRFDAAYVLPNSLKSAHLTFPPLSCRDVKFMEVSQENLKRPRSEECHLTVLQTCRCVTVWRMRQ